MHQALHQGIYQHDNILTNSIYRQLTERQQSVKSLDLTITHRNHHQEAITFLDDYLPLIEQFEVASLKKEPSLTRKRYKESMYYGELHGNTKSGRGIMVYTNGKIYQGQWKDDKKHGRGTEKFPNGTVYIGQYQLGKPHGHGRYLWEGKQQYEGEWRNGERHGNGTWYGTRGDIYEGQWRFGKPQGLGSYTSVNGDFYEGQFKQALRHGQGVQKFANGDMYRGNYLNGKPSGSGNYYWSNGSYFKGNFLNGLREGKGLWKRGVGFSDKYEGSYRSDKKWGYGQFTWASGNLYKGNYEADQRNGYGQIYWTNGASYKGQWLDGVQHGIGQIIIPGQGYKRGLFDNNCIVRVDKEQLVTNSYREARGPPVRRQRTVSKNQQKQVSKDAKNSIIRRKLVSGKPMINQPQNKGKRFHFSESKDRATRTIVHLDDYINPSKKSAKTSFDTKGPKKYWVISENGSHTKSQAGTLPLNEQKSKDFVRSQRNKHSQDKLLHSSFYLYRNGFRKDISERRYPKQGQKKRVIEGHQSCSILK